MEQGGTEERIAEMARWSGTPLPAGIANAPDLEFGLELYWVAYCDLCTCRPPSFGGVPAIPWLAVVEYVRQHDLDEAQRDRLWYFTRKMDEALRQWNEARNGDQQGPGGVRQALPGRSPWAR